MTSKQNIARQFTRSLHTYDTQAVAQRRIAEKLSEMLPTSCRRVLEIGCGTGLLTKHLVAKYGAKALYLNDLSPTLLRSTAGRLGVDAEQLFPGDAENVALPTDLDLVATASTFQWFDAPETMLARLSTMLCDGGELVMSTFGPENVNEIVQLTANALTYWSLDELREVVGRYFEVEDASEQCHALYFDSAREVLRHLHDTGVNAASRSTMTRSALEAFCSDYERLFSTEGGVRLTYHSLFIKAKKRAISAEK